MRWAIAGRSASRRTARLDPAILDSYWTHGFYVLQGVCRSRGACRVARGGGPHDRSCACIAGRQAGPPWPSCAGRGPPQGALSLGEAAERSARRGPTSTTGGIPSQMLQPKLGDDAPELTIERFDGNLHLMDECLRLYGHPDLLAVAAAILGDDFVPYNEVAFIKEPGLGPSVAWHRDGMTHWTSPDWEMGAHGFNFMTPALSQHRRQRRLGDSRHPSRAHRRHQEDDGGCGIRSPPRCGAAALRCRRHHRHQPPDGGTAPSPIPRPTGG